MLLYAACNGFADECLKKETHLAEVDAFTVQEVSVSKESMKRRRGLPDGGINLCKTSRRYAKRNNSDG
jgi:hypothetical protein